MKWKGIVSQLSHMRIATRFATAKTTHAASRRLSRNQPITRMSHRFDRRVGAELLPQTSHADVDDIRSRIEVVSPDLREQPLAADHLACVLDEMVEETELAVREL